MPKSPDNRVRGKLTKGKSILQTPMAKITRSLVRRSAEKIRKSMRKGTTNGGRIMSSVVKQSLLSNNKNLANTLNATKEELMLLKEEFLQQKHTILEQEEQLRTYEAKFDIVVAKEALLEKQRQRLTRCWKAMEKHVMGIQRVGQDVLQISASELRDLDTPSPKMGQSHKGSVAKGDISEKWHSSLVARPRFPAGLYERDGMAQVSFTDAPACVTSEWSMASNLDSVVEEGDENEPEVLDIERLRVRKRSSEIRREQQQNENVSKPAAKIASLTAGTAAHTVTLFSQRPLIPPVISQLGQEFGAESFSRGSPLSPSVTLGGEPSMVISHDDMPANCAVRKALLATFTPTASPCVKMDASSLTDSSLGLLSSPDTLREALDGSSCGDAAVVDLLSPSSPPRDAEAGSSIVLAESVCRPVFRGSPDETNSLSVTALLGNPVDERFEGLKKGHMDSQASSRLVHTRQSGIFLGSHPGTETHIHESASSLIPTPSDSDLAVSAAEHTDGRLHSTNSSREDAPIPRLSLENVNVRKRRRDGSRSSRRGLAGTMGSLTGGSAVPDDPGAVENGKKGADIATKERAEEGAKTEEIVCDRGYQEFDACDDGHLDSNCSVPTRITTTIENESSAMPSTKRCVEDLGTENVNISAKPAKERKKTSTKKHQSKKTAKKNLDVDSEVDFLPPRPKRKAAKKIIYLEEDSILLEKSPDDSPDEPVRKMVIVGKQGKMECVVGSKDGSKSPTIGKISTARSKQRKQVAPTTTDASENRDKPTHEAVFDFEGTPAHGNSVKRKRKSGAFAAAQHDTKRKFDLDSKATPKELKGDCAQSRKPLQRVENIQLSPDCASSDTECLTQSPMYRTVKKRKPVRIVESPLLGDVIQPTADKEGFARIDRRVSMRDSTGAGPVPRHKKSRKAVQFSSSEETLGGSQGSQDREKAVTQVDDEWVSVPSVSSCSQESSSPDGRRSRRSKSTKSYKEPSLMTKMRNKGH